ncbi:uncharacterized protein LOC109841134 [Asparagus officinalis]|uniref:uncharacterized protein LOC109841134 n=1 Tax=Asparagus officinalis TaxID=4686 RepID=UPI00098DF161|nr:uncharacterized protein LOC109841134 [Asparagus officinalis]
MLFNVAVDVLHKMIMNNVEEGLLSPLGLREPLKHLRILQFADDTLLFVRSSSKDISILKAILYLFEDISGLSINYSKSSLIYFGRFSYKAHNLASSLDCKVEHLPIKYLGLPLKYGKLSKSDWQPLLDNLFRNYQNGLSKKWTKSGNTNKNHQMSSKLEKGLFIRKLYGIEGSLLQSRKYNASNSHFWNAVLSFKDAFLHNVKWSIGSGDNVRFWEDKWIGYNTLASIFPESYRLALSSNVSVKSQGNFYDNKWQWHLLMRRSISPEAQAEKMSILNLINNSDISQTYDQPLWTLTSNMQFSVKSFYSFLNQRGITSPLYKVIWNPIVPSKVRFFLWLLTKNKLHTKDVLHLKGWTGDLTCSFCGLEPECRDHLFLSCPITMQVWDHFRKYFLPFNWSFALDELLLCLEILHEPKKGFFGVLFLLQFVGIYGSARGSASQKLKVKLEEKPIPRSI